MTFDSYVVKKTNRSLTMPLVCPPPRKLDVARVSRKTDEAKKFGFTLAETLITLAIIGIIAVLTIPNLLQNYKASQLRTQFFAADAYIKQATYKLAQTDKDYFKKLPK